MKIFKISQKVLYVLSCILVAFFLYGCKEKDLSVSVFDGLPESTFLTEAKTSLENHVPLAIAFTAEWCPHCRNYKPVFSEVKDLYRDKVTFINIDVDSANGSPISSRFQVRGIPTTAFVRADGSVYKVQVGEISKEDLGKIADELILNKKRKSGEPVAPFPIDTKKEEAAPQEQKPEETKPAEEVKPEEPKQPEETTPPKEVPSTPPAQEELNGDFGQIKLNEPPADDSSNEQILPPDVNKQNDNPGSGEVPSKGEPAPEQVN